METLNNPALLIINTQVDFCSSHGFASLLGRNISPIQTLIPVLKHFYREVKKQDIPVLFTQYIARKDLSPKNIRINKDREEKARMCLLNSHGSDFYLLKPKPEDVVVQHRYYDAFAQTELSQALRQVQTKTLLIAGVRTELSVISTAQRAISEGFEVVILSDLVNTYQEKQALQRELLLNFDRYYGYVKSSLEVKELLEI